MIEFRIQPAIGGVTGFASNRELAGGVIGICRCLIIRLMAGITGSRHGLKLASGRTFVTSIALDRGMRTEEWKAAIVLLYLLDRNLPSANRVALFAVCPELAAVDVGVAILATLADVREYRLHMALHAGHRAVHAAQRIASLAVIKLRGGSNGFPALCGMAVLAWNV